jgi:hypothetical protein
MIGSIGNTIVSGINKYKANALKDELLGQASEAVAQEPQTLEQRQADIQQGQIDLAEEQQVSQIQQQAGQQREQLERQRGMRELMSDPDMTQNLLDLQQRDPAMAKGVVDILLSRDQAQIEGLQQQAVLANRFQVGLAQAAADPSVSDEDVMSIVRARYQYLEANGVPTDKIVALSGKSRDEMVSWSHAQAAISQGAYKSVEMAKPLVIGKNDRIVDPNTNEVLLGAADEGMSELDKVKLQIEQKKLEQFGKTEKLTTTEIRSLNNDVGKITAPVSKIHAAASALDNLRKSNSPSDQVAGLFKFINSLDPNSTVREGELGLVTSAEGAIGSLVARYNKAVGDGQLTTQLFNNLVDTAQTLANSAIDSASGELDGYLGAYDERIPAKRNEAFRKRLPSKFSVSQASGLPEGVTEDDIATTMQENNMTREQVLERLQNGA